MSGSGPRQFFRYHPSIGHTFIPTLRARVEHEGGGYLMRVNGHGFRCDHEFEAARPPGTFRVLLFGDSYIAGDGVSNKHRFGDILECRVPGLQVYNFGLPGTGYDQHYLAYKAFAEGIEHDLLVIASPIENIRRIVAQYMTFASSDGTRARLFPRPYFELHNGELVLNNVPVPADAVEPGDIPNHARVYPRHPRKPETRRTPVHHQVRRLVYRLGPGPTRMARRLANADAAPEYLHADTPEWRLLRAILQRWVAESPAPVLIFPIPLFQHVEEKSSPAGYQQRFAELHDPPDVTVHDPLPHLLRYSKDERRAHRFPMDIHPTPAGHEALASALEPAIRAQMAAQREEIAV